MQAYGALAPQTEQLDAQEPLAKNISNLETEKVLHYFVTQQVDAQTKRKALVMAQKLLKEKIEKAQSLIKSWPDMWSIATGAMLTSVTFGIFKLAGWVYDNRNMYIDGRVEDAVNIQKGRQASHGLEWSADLENFVRRDTRAYYNILFGAGTGYVQLASLWHGALGIKKILDGLTKADAQEKLKKATVIEFFLRTVQNNQTN